VASFRISDAASSEEEDAAAPPGPAAAAAPAVPIAGVAEAR
jgi:hypothetical protein